MYINIAYKGYKRPQRPTNWPQRLHKATKATKGHKGYKSYKGNLITHLIGFEPLKHKKDRQREAEDARLSQSMEVLEYEKYSLTIRTPKDPQPIAHT